MKVLSISKKLFLIKLELLGYQKSNFI